MTDENADTIGKGAPTGASNAPTASTPSTPDTSPNEVLGGEPKVLAGSTPTPTTPAPAVPQESLAESVGLTTPKLPMSPEVAKTQAPIGPPPQVAIVAASGNLNADIEKILREVKLPERREFKAGADAPKSPVPEVQTPPAPETKPSLAEAVANETRPPLESHANISSVHTLKDDLQHAVKEKKMSLVRAVSLEQDRKKTELAEEDFGRKERRKRTIGILFATALLFGLGGAALFGVYLVMLSHSATDIQQLDSMVFAEQSVALPLNNASASDLKRRVAAERQTQVGALGSITRIVPILQGTDPSAQPKVASTGEFLQAIGANAPDDLVRYIGTDFFFGLHVVDENAPLLVIPVLNYDRAFAAMLAWEPGMNTSLAPMFTPVPATTLDANGIPYARTFKDDVMHNYDVRELKDDTGQVQLYYSFPSTNLLIIAESPYSFPELLSRLQSIRRL